MTESQRRPVPRVDTGELDTALAFLDFARDSVLAKADGVPDDLLRRPGVPSGTSPAAVLSGYRAAGSDSNAIVRGIGDPNAPVARAVDGAFLSLRWVLAHMTSETVRHAGHADILREQLDGVTGR